MTLGVPPRLVSYVAPNRLPLHSLRVEMISVCHVAHVSVQTYLGEPCTHSELRRTRGVIAITHLCVTRISTPHPGLSTDERIFLPDGLPSRSPSTSHLAHLIWRYVSCFCDIAVEYRQLT